MRINKEKLEALTNLPDDKLWAEIVAVAASYGFALPKETPPKETLAKLRSAVSGDKLNVADAIKVLNKYRKGCK